ncbi:hypothetical protein [Mycoplasma sp. CSL7503-lung]|uniref:hypothetical protein n=1 Tax=Mycoplasma sp. CSL7503-lung TaxID=536372 RepID=UPI0021D04633|nr:hypothetical protein [Mycoplasma sp. CSL7503-lung]MCU4706492.1 hypothetical protein [Mycoplasma sp. CSL7503-lung]
MKRKFWLKTISLTLTSAGLVSLASCSNPNSNSKNSDDYKKLQLEYKKYRKQNENNSKAKDDEISKLKNELSESVTEKDSKNSELVELSGKIDELTRKIQVMSGTVIERNGLSIRNLYNQISNFIISDFTTALKEQKPETYNKEKNLLDQIVASIVSTNADVATTEEDFANLWTWESTVFHLLSRSKLIYEYIDDTINPITVYTPRSEEMDLLFQWRINDLNRIISIVNSKPQGTYENKQELLDRLQSYVEKYQQAIDESSLLQHQISFWYNLEQDGDDGVANKFIDFSSPNMRSLLPSLKISDSEFRVSLFPVYKQITDPKFISEAKAKVLELQGIYKQWIDSNVRTYINSVRYDKLYNSVKSIIDRINVLLLPNNLTYFNEFNVWEDLNKFVNDAKAVLLDGYLVDNTKEKQDYDNEVSQEFDKNRDGSFYKVFDTEFKPLSTGNEKKTVYLYKDFYTKYSRLMDQIKSMSTNTFQESFLRYVKYQVTKREVEISKKIIDFYKKTGDDLENEELNNLLRLNNSAKYDKSIRQATLNKERDTNNFNEQKELLKNFDIEYVSNSDKENVQDKLNDVNEKLVPVIDTFIEKLQSTKNENNDIISDWGYMYGESNSNKLITSLTNIKELIGVAVSLINNDNESENNDVLNQKMIEIKNQSNKFIKLFVGNLEGTSNENQIEEKSLVGEFNEKLSSEAYDLEGSTYDSQIKIFLDIKSLFGFFKNIDLESVDKERIQKDLESKASLVNIYINELEHIFESEKPWNELYESLVGEIRDELKNTLDEFNRKIESAKEGVNNDNFESELLKELKEYSKDKYDKVGDLSDGIPPIVEVLKETLESYDRTIERSQRKKESIPSLSKILAAQEVVVLLRYWKNNVKPEYDKIQLHVDPQGNDTYHDKEMANYLNKEISNVSKGEGYNLISNVDGTLESFDVNVEDNNENNDHQNEFFEGVDQITPKVIYDKFKEIETNYAKSLYEFLFNNENNNVDLKNDLFEKRQIYYSFLNKLSEMDVFLSNSYIRFGVDLLIYDQYDTSSNFLLSDLLSYYAKTAAVSDIMTEIHEKYIK